MGPSTCSNIKNNRFIAQQVRCCVLHSNPLRKALMLPQFANEMLRFCMSLTCQIPMTIQGQCWSMSKDFCVPHLYPHGALQVQKRSIKEEHGSVRSCDGNKQKSKRPGWIVIVLCEIKAQVPKCCTAGCLFKWVIFVPFWLHSHWLE